MALELGTVGSTEEALENLTSAFADFVRAGGVFSWKEWEGMIQPTRDCAIAAGEQVDQERADRMVEEIYVRWNEGAQAARADAILDAASRVL